VKKYNNNKTIIEAKKQNTTTNVFLLPRIAPHSPDIMIRPSFHVSTLSIPHEKSVVPGDTATQCGLSSQLSK